MPRTPKILAHKKQNREMDTREVYSEYDREEYRNTSKKFDLMGG